MTNKKILPCVLGLGYVGMPIFNILNKKFKTLGFDINKRRIIELKNKHDRNNEFSKKNLVLKNKSSFSSQEKEIKDSAIEQKSAAKVDTVTQLSGKRQRKIMAEFKIPESLANEVPSF